MCQRAVDRTSNWLMVDTWEPMHKEYQPTAIVLDHFDYEINTVRQGIETGNGSRKPVQVVLLAGADLVHTMSTPGVWSEKDLDHILGKYGGHVRSSFLAAATPVPILSWFRSRLVEPSVHLAISARSRGKGKYVASCGRSAASGSLDCRTVKAGRMTSTICGR